MSKMGQELDKRLEENKWEMWESYLMLLPEIAYLETTRLDDTQRYYVDEIKKIVREVLVKIDYSETLDLRDRKQLEDKISMQYKEGIK